LSADESSVGNWLHITLRLGDVAVFENLQARNCCRIKLQKLMIKTNARLYSSAGIKAQ